VFKKVKICEISAYFWKNYIHVQAWQKFWIHKLIALTNTFQITHRVFPDFCSSSYINAQKLIDHRRYQIHRMSSCAEISFGPYFFESRFVFFMKIPFVWYIKLYISSKIYIVFVNMKKKIIWSKLKAQTLAWKKNSK